MTTFHKSLIITLAGYILTSLVAYFIVYPAFGITVLLLQSLLIGAILTGVAFASNYVCLMVFDKLNKEKYID